MTIERVPPLYLVNFLEILIHPFPASPLYRLGAGWNSPPPAGGEGLGKSFFLYCHNGMRQAYPVSRKNALGLAEYGFGVFSMKIPD